MISSVSTTLSALSSDSIHLRGYQTFTITRISASYGSAEIVVLIVFISAVRLYSGQSCCSVSVFESVFYLHIEMVTRYETSLFIGSSSTLGIVPPWN